MVEAVVIRPVRIEDVADLEEVCHQLGVLVGTLNIPSEQLLDRRRRTEDLGPNVHELVAVVDGRVVGTAGLVAFEGRMNHAGEIAPIMVRDEFKGRLVDAVTMARIRVEGDRCGSRRRLSKRLLKPVPNTRVIGTTLPEEARWCFPGPDCSCD